jgi:iron complex outermembrane receptor protein
VLRTRHLVSFAQFAQREPPLARNAARSRFLNVHSCAARNSHHQSGDIRERRMTKRLLQEAIRKGLGSGGTAGIAAAIGLAVLPVSAQDAAGDQGTEQLETIVVTGSRIRSVDVETAQPILVIDRAEIEHQGAATVEDILNRLSVTSGNILNRSVNNGNNGQVNISLRNLGSARTLVLVNGHRWVSQLAGNVDLTTIPSSIIERIEVLKDGASAIYGSDAIGGVVNVITRDRYDGAEAHAYYGEYDEGDGTTQTYDFTMGANSDRASILFNVAYTKGDPVFAGDRHISADPVLGAGPSRYSFYGDHGIIYDPSFGTLAINPDASSSNDLANFHPYDFAQDGWNFAPQNYLLTPTERRSVFVQGRYDITDNIRFRTDVLYNQRNSDQELAAIPAAFGIDVDSYYNPIGNQGVGIPPGEGIPIGFAARRFREAGNRNFAQEVKTYHFAGGFEGNFDLGSRSFNWDLGFQTNETGATQVTHGQLSVPRITQGTGPSFLDPVSGQVVCGTPGNIIAGCVPLDIIGPAGSLTPEMIDFIQYTDKAQANFRTTNYFANITGNLFDLPAGPLSFAAGYEYRKEAGFFEPDAFTAAGNGTGNAAAPTRGNYSLDEFYLEFAVPILADLPLARELSLDIAARRSDYDNFGETTNGKIGIKWKPIDDLLLRGNYAEGFRAPSISELFGGTGDNFPTYNDPCDRVDGRSSSDPGVAAACDAAGVPGDYTQRGGYGGQVRFPTTVESNPNAGPETATTRTLGFVYSPSYVDGLDIQLDWWQIELENTINAPSLTFMLDQCVTNGDYCGLITRNPNNGEVVGARQITQNLGATRTEGYDLGVNYRLPEFSFGRFSAGMNATYTSVFDQQADPDAEFRGRVGQLGNPNWRLRANFNLDWTLGDWGATYRARYFSSVREPCVLDERCSQPDHIDAVIGPDPLTRAGAVTYHDFQVRWTAPWDGTITLGLNNAFDKGPPVLLTSFANSYDPNYDIPGRFWYVEYRQKL